MTVFDVSVVVPAYMAADFLARTLDAVRAQTLAPREVLVVDDGSTDDTSVIADAFAQTYKTSPVRVLREPHRGPGAARNAGVRAAVGTWISFLDSDDLWRPTKLEVMAAAIAAHPSANFFCHNETIYFLDGTSLDLNYAEGYDPRRRLPRQLYCRNFFSTSAVVCRRDLVLKWGGFDETLSSAQDYELWLRMSPDIVPVFVPDILGSYVMRAGNITTSRYWRRLVNGLRVQYAHRAKAGHALFAYEAAKLTALHLARRPLSAVRQILRPRPRYGEHA